jgi:hypothetical protein
MKLVIYLEHLMNIAVVIVILVEVGDIWEFQTAIVK